LSVQLVVGVRCDEIAAGTTLPARRTEVAVAQDRVATSPRNHAAAGGQSSVGRLLSVNEFLLTEVLFFLLLFLIVRQIEALQNKDEALAGRSESVSGKNETFVPEKMNHLHTYCWGDDATEIGDKWTFPRRSSDSNY
jgi:hypothetical protein